MKTPLSPLDFMRRARRLYAAREAVVDGDVRLTYAQFFERADRWAAVLQSFGIGFGDRVAYLAPNTHGLLEAFYAVPQIGAILVPINYRLVADDFAYIINHSGSRIVCAHSDQLDAIDSIRDKIPNVERFVALEGARATAGSTTRRSCPKAASPVRPGDFRRRADHDQLHERYHG